MPEAEIIVELRDGVALVTFNRPEKLNALTGANFTDLMGVFRRLARDETVRAAILTGRGRGFCVGADLAANAPLGDEGAGDVAGDATHAVLTLAMRSLKEFPKPLVAAVNGLAVGGGMSIALAADIIVAARSARFTQVFTPSLGIVPDCGSTWLLPRAIGSARATGMMMLGEPLTAETALDWGMIWACVDDEALMDEAWGVARRLAGGPTLGFGLLKGALAVSAANSFHEQLHVEAEANRAAFATEDTLEAMRAFGEKRPPNFRGR